MTTLEGLNNQSTAFRDAQSNPSIRSINLGEMAALRGVAANGSPAQPAVTPAAAPDQAQVSTTAQIVNQALNASDVRTEKVAALQAAIASGSYQVPASEVAGKIVDHLLE